MRFLNRAIQANWNRPTASDLVLLAICEQGRGNSRQARRYYQEALDWSQWYVERSPLIPKESAILEAMLSEAKDLLGTELATRADADEWMSQSQHPRAIMRLDDEQLIALAKTNYGQLTRQEMGQFGPCWSGGHQLWWIPSAVRGRVILPINVEIPGEYAILISCTKANDYGKFQLHVNDQAVGEPVWTD